MDEQTCLVLLFDKKAGCFVDKTSQVAEIDEGVGRVRVTFHSGKAYDYNEANVDIRHGQPEEVADTERVLVKGVMRERASTITRFGDRTRVTHTDGGSHCFCLSWSTDVSVVSDVASQGTSREVLDYWRSIASSLPAQDPTRKTFERLSFVHPESVLATYLEARALAGVEEPVQAIYPFTSNISQRIAIDHALSQPLSVVEGPPGTGKTQAILNMVASVVAAGKQTVAVVSATNSAVDNVREKLERLGIGYVAAALGNRDNQTAFLADQARRNAVVGTAMARPVATAHPDGAKVQSLSERLHLAQECQRERARTDTELAAYQLEYRHFRDHLADRHLPDLGTLPLLRKAPEKILDYLVETSLDRVKPGLIKRLRRYFSYGPTGQIDPQDIDVVLGLQDTYYRRRIDELTARRDDLTGKLERADLDRIAEKHRSASLALLDDSLRRRYGSSPRRTYPESALSKDPTFFDDYPVILSTCHSLDRNLPPGKLLDLVIIDESSQVSLLLAAPVMACARRVVIVGDTRQLPHIPGVIPEGLTPPHPAYDHRVHSLLSSVHSLYGDALPQTMLVEHYRCAPDIIGFCNRSFYDGSLIPFTQPDPTTTPMRVWVTTEGNHMKSLKNGGGTSNQREIDVIREEVIPTLGLVGRDVGYIAPYRLQANLLGELTTGADDPLMDISVPTPASKPKPAADTTHRWQGRECDVVVFSSVADNSWRGARALRFVDDARLINVAVSRAINEFILVAHHDRHPRSRYLADLIGYIEYHDPEAVQQSAVVSIFDLLYKDYSARLRPFAARIRGTSKYPSENVAGTLIEDILTEAADDEPYRGLSMVPQYRLKNLFTDLDRFTAEQARFIGTTSSVDFLIYRRVSLRPVLAIEVDGWGFHADDPRQQIRDGVKDSIFTTAGLPLLRLPTNGSGEREKIIRALDAALLCQTHL